MRTTTRVALFAGILATAGAGVQQQALGHGGATGVVKQRMELMENLGDAMKALAGMISGKVAFDSGTAEEAAGMLRRHAGDELTALFPEGSATGPSEARNRIWSEWAEFEQLAGDLEIYADALRTSLQRGDGVLDAGGMTGSGMRSMDGMMGTASAADLAEMPPRGLFKMAAQTCKSCHARFREKK